jgi:hypothetical protein
MISTGQKIGLLRGFLTGPNAYTGPILLSLKLTSRCNLNCFGCPYYPAAGKPLMEKPGRPMDVSFELVQKVSKEAAPDWHRKRDSGGGVIFNETVHHFDLW